MSAARNNPWKAILARAGDHWCALPLGRVRQVLSSPKLYPLPGSSDEVAGLAEVEGEPVVILSLGKLIAAPEGAKAEFPVTLLVAADPANPSEWIGLAADEAGDIVRIDDAEVVGPAKGPVRGEVRLEGRLVRILDLNDLGQPQ